MNASRDEDPRQNRSWFDRARFTEARERAGARWGRPIRLYDLTSSTNDRALEAIAGNDRTGIVWLARQQTQGRGRRGKEWHTRPGDCLMFSVLVRVPGRDFPAGGETLAAGLAVRQVVATHLPEGLVCRVKWPNDVWVDDRKLSGILVESRPDPAGGHALVIGVGLNLRTPPLPELPTTSLEALGATVCAPEVLLAECLASLEQRLPRVLSRGVATILDEFAAWDALADRQIEVELETGETWSGRGRGLDSEGHLMLETNGLKRAVRAGHVRLPARSGVRRAAPAPGANDS